MRAASGLRWTLPVIALLVTSAASADDFEKTTQKFRDAVNEVFFNDSYGYAVFPTIGKGGIGIGGARGKGQVYEGGAHVGNSTMTQVTVGFQLGGQAYSQIIFFENQAAFEDFTSGNFEFGAQATAVAITAGASASAGTTGTGAGASSSSGGNAKAGGDYYKGCLLYTSPSPRD